MLIAAGGETMDLSSGDTTEGDAAAAAVTGVTSVPFELMVTHVSFPVDVIVRSTSSSLLSLALAAVFSLLVPLPRMLLNKMSNMRSSSARRSFLVVCALTTDFMMDGGALIGANAAVVRIGSFRPKPNGAQGFERKIRSRWK